MQKSELREDFPDLVLDSDSVIILQERRKPCDSGLAITMMLGGGIAMIGAVAFGGYEMCT